MHCIYKLLCTYENVHLYKIIFLFRPRGPRGDRYADDGERRGPPRGPRGPPRDPRDPRDPDRRGDPRDDRRREDDRRRNEEDRERRRRQKEAEASEPML